jgi:ribosome-associated toxin RatA of RatAB toxin-antitoxin module
VKRLNATADTAVRASPAECMQLLEAVDRYPEWHPEVVRKVTVLARDEGALASKVEARLHVSRGPLSRDLELMLAVSTDEPLAIRLTRLPYDPTDQEEFELIWRVEGSSETRIGLALAANLDLPRALPLGGVGEAMARGFLAAAARALDERARR